LRSLHAFFSPSNGRGCAFDDFIVLPDDRKLITLPLPILV
jgi:hypothetical protein